MRCLWFSGCTANILWRPDFCQAPVFIPRSAAADLDSPKDDETVKVLGHGGYGGYGGHGGRDSERSFFGVVFLFINFNFNSCLFVRLRQMKQRLWALWAVGGDASRD